MHYLDPKFIIETLGLVGTTIIIFAESGLFFGFFLPGDSLLFTAGLLASQNLIALWPLFIYCFIASVLGDTVGYAFGKKVGPKIFSKEESLFWNKSHIQKTKSFFGEHGKKAVILARFTPIVRTFTPILAGVGQMDYPIFLRYNLVGAILWTASMIFGGFWFGKIIPNPDKYLLPIIAVIIILSISPQLKALIKRK